MRRLWILLAAVMAVAATVLAVLRDYDKAFVLAAAGAVSWFLSYRVQMRQLTDSDQQHRQDDDDVDSRDEDA